MSEQHRHCTPPSSAVVAAVLTTLLCCAPLPQTGASKKKTLSAVAKKEKVVTKARDPSLPPRSIRYSLPDLIELVPKPEPDTPQEDWQHKHGWGLKFYRKRWARYAEPSYWTVTRYKPSTHGHKRKVWGVLTWRGQTGRAQQSSSSSSSSAGTMSAASNICQSAE
jgi:hypothetical protein